SKLYFGIDRPIVADLAVPASAEGEVSVQLMSPLDAEGNTKTIAMAEASAGSVDLAALFPILWSNEAPRSTTYAQAFAGDTAVGPALVLQPLLTPKSAVASDPRSAPQFSTPPGGGTYAGLRVYVDRDVLLDTTAGNITVRLRPDHAPNAAWNFRSLVDGGFYEDILFHRIIDARPGREPFVVQVGDPTGTGTGGPGYFIDLEDSKLPHDFGVISMARSGDPNSNGSQVFLCLSRGGTAFLDGRYTTFGQSIDGADAIRAIAETPVAAGDRPTGSDLPKIITARLVDAAPHGTGMMPVQNPLEAGSR
ncbi:MAG: peptidylprolyl isomerase, partial [Planctomycetota bacterium]